MHGQLPSGQLPSQVSLLLDLPPHLLAGQHLESKGVDGSDVLGMGLPEAASHEAQEGRGKQNDQDQDGRGTAKNETCKTIIECCKQAYRDV